MYALSAGLTSHANLEPRLARLHVPPIAGVGSETQLVYTLLTSISASNGGHTLASLTSS